MSARAHVDSLTVVNGPEDGAEFPIARAPFDIGSDGSCAVILRLDNTVYAQHARATAAADGYRIRSLNGARVYVNGKRAGAVRSRILHPGDFMRVGYTELVLECAPGGLASRSRGLVLESDFAWCAKRAVVGSVGIVAVCARFLLRLPGRLLRNWPAVVIPAAIAAYLLYPPARTFFGNLVNAALRIVRELAARAGV